MSKKEELDEQAWPPGTVRLETLHRATREVNIVLQPRPSDDPNDPLNWPRWRKNWNFALVAYYAMMVFVLIDAATPTWGPMNEQLGFSYAILNDSYAIGCGTLAFGAFLLIPFALKYGRRPIYIISTAVQLGMCIWSARIQNVADLLLVNAFSCMLGALAEVIVQMTIADCFFVHQRGLMNSIFVWMENLGGFLGPLAAGYITISQGWRWVWWWCAIFFGLALVVYVFAYEETKYNHIATPSAPPEKVEGSAGTGAHEFSQSRRDGEALTASESTVSDAEAGIDPETARKLSIIHINPAIPRRTYWQKLGFTTKTPGSFHHFARHAYQPFMILFTIPAVGFMSLVYGVTLVWSTVMTVTLSSWMLGPPWNFSAAQIGLMSLPPFVGNTLGTLICGPMSDLVILRLARRNNGIFEPEMRLWVMAPFIPFLPLGAFLFGFGLNDGWSWEVIAVSYALSTFGSAPIMSIALTYITDSYTEIVGDALVGVTFTRNVLATIFVFALTPWLDAVGMANVYITIGVIGTAVLAFNFVFIWKGKQFRLWNAKRYRYYAARQFEARRV